ncbi:MAG: acyltransferase [Methylococcales bacterium]|nr:acyltransferase [Methylococcales bacterium]
MFLSYIHNFRGIAILYIVAGHSISAFNWEQSPVQGRLTRMLLENGTVFFVFIAGYLFQYLSYKYVPKKYFLSKLSTVVLPYLLVSIPAIVTFVFFQERESLWPGFYDNPRWLQIIYFYLTGLHLAPLWFIPMICLFYCISPLLLLMDRYSWTYLLLPVLVIVSCHVPRGNIFESFVHFFSVYFFGMFLSHYRVVVNEHLTKPLVLSLLIFDFFALVYIEYFLADDPYINLIRKLFVCCLFIGLLVKFNISNKILELLAKESFGIFFIHSYVISSIKIAEQHFLGQYLEGSLVAFIFFIMIVLLSCMAIIGLIKKLFAANSKYLIGC